VTDADPAGLGPALAGLAAEVATDPETAVAAAWSLSAGLSHGLGR
jgi:hypothetical protein